MAQRIGARRTPLAVSLIFVGCAAAGPHTVVEPRELDEAGSSPRITAVEDLGGIDIPANGQVRSHGGDGVAVIGETLCIRGRQFGRQPTVSIGGQVAAAVSRTGDGGILVRVPVGTPVGAQRVSVTQEHGTGEHPLEVRRLGALRASGRLVWLELGAQGARVRGSSALTGAQHLQLSADARAAYVVDGQGSLTTFELAAPGVPAVAAKVELGAGPVRALLAPSAAHMLLVLRERDLVVLDTSMSLRPGSRETRPLPAWLRGSRPLRAAISPDGKLLALGFPERNRVAVIGLAGLTPTSQAPPDLTLAELRAPMLVDLAFAPDGATLWALTGSNEANRSLGPLPTTVHALRIDGAGSADPRLERARAVVIDAASFPVAVSVGRGLALTSGAAIRLPPEKATVFVAARTREGDRPVLFAVGAEDTATALHTEPRSAFPGRPDVTPDGRWLMGPVVEGAGDVRLASAPADGRPGATSSVVVTSLGTGAGPSASAATPLAEVRLQP
jgi:hypothetical protein